MAEAKYTAEQIASICEEIERQWDLHLVTRAVFPVNVMKQPERSPPFYRQFRVNFQLINHDPESPLVRRALPSIPHWLNQNFILRLFGILDEDFVITAGRQMKNPFTGILAELRHVVGGHTRGKANVAGKTFKKVTRLIKTHIDPAIELEKVKDFALDVKMVLRPLKDGVIAFVKSLEGTPIPVKGQPAQDEGGTR